MLGTCMYCNNERIVEDAEVKDFAEHNGISVEMAADAVAARQCNCSGATFFRNREKKSKWPQITWSITSRKTRKCLSWQR